MMQSVYRRVPALLACALAVTTAAGCDRSKPSPPAQSSASAQGAVVTVASLVPAASDLIVGMGAGDRLVAVSNYDVPDDQTRALPRVGDYQTIDWEKLAEIRPRAMVVQFDAGRIPPGLTQRADALGITVVNIRNNRLDDIYSTMSQLAGAMGINPRATEASATLRAQLDAVAAGVVGKPRVRVLMVMDDGAQSVVGSDTFLGDVLAIAGGENVLADADKPYLNIDREQLLSLKPDVIIQLRPSATRQEVDRARQTMATLTDVPAAREGRVHVLTEPWVLLPGYHVGELAERFAAALHGRG